MSYKNRVFTICLSFFINLVLFFIVSSLSGGAKYKILSTKPVSIEVITFRKPKMEAKRRKQRMVKKKIFCIPSVTFGYNLNKRPKIQNFSLPRLDLEINPELKVGLNIPPPKLEIPKMYTEGDVDQAPMPLSCIKPFYPYRARRMGITGKVIVKFLVDEKGEVKKIKIVDAKPKGVFERAVLSAVRHWRFLPAKEGGKTVACWVIKPIEFQLE